MELVLDANIIFATLIKRSFTFGLIKSLFRKGTRLYLPEYVREEIEKREDKLLRYSKLSSAELEFLIKILFKRFEVVPKSEYEKFISKAEQISPDPKDIPYFALALKLNCPIWSNEKRFKKQSRVKVFSTEDLLEILKLR